MLRAISIALPYRSVFAPLEVFYASQSEVFNDVLYSGIKHHCNAFLATVPSAKLLKIYSMQTIILLLVRRLEVVKPQFSNWPL